jgi:hypothetical protein
MDVRPQLGGSVGSKVWKCADSGEHTDNDGRMIMNLPDTIRFYRPVV